MLRMLRVEIRKLQFPLIGGIALAGPAFAVLLGAGGGTPAGMDPWIATYSFAAMRYAWLFYPLLAGVFAALLCRTEHANGGWKQMLSLPVSRSHVYLAKLVVLVGALAAANVAFAAVAVASGTLTHLAGPVPWSIIARSIVSGWVAVLPLAALQLWISSRWKSFGAALALNVCFTLPAIFAAQSREIGPWYPWAQPMLAMTPLLEKAGGPNAFNVSPTTLWVVIVGGLILALAGGLITFGRADLRA